MPLDKLSLIRSPRRESRWYLISAVIHLAVIAGLILLFKPLERPSTVMIDLGPSPEVRMPAYLGPGGGDTSRAPTPRVASPGRPLPPVPVTPPAVVAEGGGEATPDGIGSDTVDIGTHRQLGPDYGDGRLWVYPGDAEGGNVPARVGVDSLPRHVAKVDSALAAKIRAYLDTVPPDSFATRAAPKWTTEIAGKTWGIDGKWIYLAGMKIPTAVLAMLPIPAEAGGNYDAQQREARINAMRRDIIESAQRQANRVEFNRYVKELRERKDTERRARETPDPPLPPPVSSPTPVASDTAQREEPLIP